MVPFKQDNHKRELGLRKGKPREIWGRKTVRPCLEEGWQVAEQPKEFYIPGSMSWDFF